MIFLASEYDELRRQSRPLDDIKNLTTERKVEILRDMIPFIDDYICYGLCGAFKNVTNTNMYTLQDAEQLCTVFPELRKFKDNPYGNTRMWWWPITVEGKETRIRVLQVLLEKYEEQLINQTNDHDDEQTNV